MTCLSSIFVGMCTLAAATQVQAFTVSAGQCIGRQAAGGHHLSCGHKRARDQCPHVAGGAARPHRRLGGVASGQMCAAAAGAGGGAVQLQATSVPWAGSHQANTDGVPPSAALAVAPRSPKPGWLSIKTKKGTLNHIGVLFAISAFGWAIVIYPILTATYVWAQIVRSKKRRAVDWVVHMWAKISMLTMTYHPKVRGLENLPAHGEPVMYIANHCSYFDILTLSGFMPRGTKYISKIEVLRIPLIGWAMRMAQHIAIRRNSAASHKQTFKQTVQSLRAGNAIVAFAEGTRSASGRMGNFKLGVFKMAKEAGVRIVPVTLSNTHVTMPSGSLMPLAVPRNVEIVVHPPIDSADKDADTLSKMTYNAILSALPEWQKPLPAGAPDEAS